MFHVAADETRVSPDEAGATLWAAANTARKLAAAVTVIVRRVPGRVSFARRAGRANGVAVQVELGPSSLVIRFAGDALASSREESAPIRLRKPNLKRPTEAHVR